MGKVFSVPGKLNDALKQSERVLNTDSLINNAGSLVKDLFK